MHAMMGVHSGSTTPRALVEISPGVTSIVIMSIYVPGIKEKNGLFAVSTRSGRRFPVADGKSKIRSTARRRLVRAQRGRQRQNEGERERQERKWKPKEAMDPLFVIDSRHHGKGPVIFSWHPHGTLLASSGSNRIVHIFTCHGQLLHSIKSATSR